MNDQIRQALARDRTIDITTIGRTSGRERRIETWFYRDNGQVYLTGSPGRRDWYANLLANPSFTFHLKQGVRADLAARATPITDLAAKRAILTRVTATVGQSSNVEAWVARSPLVLVHFDDD